MVFWKSFLLYLLIVFLGIGGASNLFKVLTSGIITLGELVATALCVWGIVWASRKLFKLKK